MLPTVLGCFFSGIESPAAKPQHTTSQLQIRCLTLRGALHWMAPVPVRCRQGGVAPAPTAADEGGAHLAVGHSEGNGWKALQHELPILDGGQEKILGDLGTMLSNFLGRNIEQKIYRKHAHLAEVVQSVQENVVTTHRNSSPSICLIPLRSHWKAIGNLLRRLCRAGLRTVHRKLRIGRNVHGGPETLARHSQAKQHRAWATWQRRSIQKKWCHRHSLNGDTNSSRCTQKVPTCGAIKCQNSIYKEYQRMRKGLLVKNPWAPLIEPQCFGYIEAISM